MGHQASLIIVHWFQDGDRKQVRRSRPQATVPDSMSTVSMTLLGSRPLAGRGHPLRQRPDVLPECNLLIRAGERDVSGVPDYNAVVEVLPAS